MKGGGRDQTDVLQVAELNVRLCKLSGMRDRRIHDEEGRRRESERIRGLGVGIGVRTNVLISQASKGVAEVAVLTAVSAAAETAVGAGRLLSFDLDHDLRKDRGNRELHLGPKLAGSGSERKPRRKAR